MPAESLSEVDHGRDPDELAQYARVQDPALAEEAAYECDVEAADPPERTRSLHGPRSPW